MANACPWLPMPRLATLASTSSAIFGGTFQPRTSWCGWHPQLRKRARKGHFHATSGPGGVDGRHAGPAAAGAGPRRVLQALARDWLHPQLPSRARSAQNESALWRHLADETGETRRRGRPPPAQGPRGRSGKRHSHHVARLPQRAAPVTPRAHPVLTRRTSLLWGVTGDFAHAPPPASRGRVLVSSCRRRRARPLSGPRCSARSFGRPSGSANCRRCALNRLHRQRASTAYSRTSRTGYGWIRCWWPVASQRGVDMRPWCQL